MTRQPSAPDQTAPPRDDFEAAATIQRTLEVHTDAHRRTDLPDDVEADLNAWLNPYVTRRRAETGVSPLASQLIEYFLDWSGLDWTHRAPTTNVVTNSDFLRAGSTDYTLMRADTPRAADKALVNMHRNGWGVTAVWSGDDHHTVELEFRPVQNDFEVLRRLLIAGLTQTEAITYWATDIVDLQPRNIRVNDFLEDTSTGCVGRVARLADALDTPREDIGTATNAAREKLSAIDPGLPQLLQDGTGGHPLPDELWSTHEQTRLGDAQ